jgi:hypothetical protein
MRRRLLIAGAVVLFAAAAGAAAIISTRGDATPSRRHAATSPPAAASLAARFAVLRNAHSNRCGMPASALDTMPPGARLQGACCFPMNYHAYVHQARELNRRYATVEVIPKDPYDVPVSLAKRLLGYRSITLTPQQQGLYERAKPLSETKGPCCCPCWRWDAFEGQANYLITRRHYSAKQIADVWTLEEGCGGAG